MEKNSTTPHVLIFPQQAQGHVKPMLNLAELLCLANIRVTFLVTAQVHHRLVEYTDTEARFARYKAGFRLKVIPDGPPPNISRNDDHKKLMASMVQSIAVNAKPVLEEMLLGHHADTTTTRVTCLIADGFYSFAYDVANEAGVLVILFRCASACCLWAYFCAPALIDAGQIPFQDEDMDELVENVAGMDTFLRYRDLPSFCRTKDKLQCLGLKYTYATEVERTKEVYGLILNTFEDLEGPILSLLRSQCSKVYSVGPLHALLQHQLTQESATTTTLSNSSCSLWEVEDQSVLSWLDQKPDKSVVYVGFGSLAVLERDQLEEVWEGLVQSNKYFVWVIKQDLMNSNDENCRIWEALLEGTKERGCIVKWAPQEAVLKHRAIGGFLTHSGWNSTIESITAGVPMICLPYFADQQINSRYVGEVWKIGLDMKDIYDKNVVTEMVNDLLDRNNEKVLKSMSQMSEAAMKSVTKGGSSYSNLDSLIHDIKTMSNLKGEHSVLSSKIVEEKDHDDENENGIVTLND